MLRGVVFGFLIAISSIPASGGAPHSGSPAIRKSLPLDTVPNVVPKRAGDSQYLPDRLIVKVMPGAGIGGLGTAVEKVSAYSITPLFPQEMVTSNRTTVDLSLFYVLHYSSPVDAFAAAKVISRFPEINYAEPWYVYRVTRTPLSTPDDPFFFSQWGLLQIHAPEAWDISTGDTTVVIGIVDSGVETAHPDLAGNIWANPGETGLDNFGRDKRTNNVDDDGNGYVDDWKGWDFGGADYHAIVGDNDPDPTASNNSHGTHVAGIAAAVGNNTTGVAGVAYRCRILPVKTAADNDTRDAGSGLIIAGYEGVAYAAFVGASVINCSWTGSGGSQVEQDIISYATQQGALVVAAAGNSNSNAPGYPGAYAGVISVAATNSSDGKSSFSNFGSTIDVSAPGESIISTLFPGMYASWSGTSMASPMAAGLAALVKSTRPNFSALQLGEQLRMTCDNIDALNPGYAGLLGGGRINGSRALTESPSSVRVVSFALRDSLGGNGNGSAEPGEQIDFAMTFVNFLAPSNNAVATLTTATPGLSVVNGNFTIGALGTMESVASLPFRLQVSPTVPPGLAAAVTVRISDGIVSSSQDYAFVVNPTFQTQSINNIAVTLTNNGRIGFNDFPNNLQGIGCIYPKGGDNLLYEGGLIVGFSETKVVDNIRNASGGQNNDFVSSGFYSVSTPGILSNQEGFSLYSDSGASSGNRIGVAIHQRSFSFSAPGDEDYIIISYTIENLTSQDLSGLYVGQFFDWDIRNYSTNRTGYDVPRGIAYAWDDSDPSTPYIGVCALDGVSSVRGLVNSTSIALDYAAKWDWISGGTLQASAAPGDIHSVVSSGPFSVPPGDSVLVGFAIVGGADLASTQVHADSARGKWGNVRHVLDVRTPVGLPSAFALFQNYPNPFNPTTRIDFTVGEVSGQPSAVSDVRLVVYDILGREVRLLVNEVKSAGTYTVSLNASGLATGVYFYKMTAGSFSAVRKLVVMR